MTKSKTRTWGLGRIMWDFRTCGGTQGRVDSGPGTREHRDAGTRERGDMWTGHAGRGYSG